MPSSFEANTHYRGLACPNTSESSRRWRHVRRPVPQSASSTSASPGRESYAMYLPCLVSALQELGGNVSIRRSPAELRVFAVHNPSRCRRLNPSVARAPLAYQRELVNAGLIGSFLIWT